MTMKALMAVVCRALLAAYIVLCVLSLLLIPASNYSLAGLEPDALAGVFAIVLGLPWSLLPWPGEVSSELLSVAIIAAGMLANAVLLGALCRWLRR